MDPNETLARIRRNLDDDTEMVADAFRDLDEWLSRGGFLPSDWQTAGHTVSLSTPCQCGGTFLPVNKAASFDADGSAMVSTHCNRCHLQSVSYFTWDTPDD